MNDIQYAYKCIKEKYLHLKLIGGSLSQCSIEKFINIPQDEHIVIGKGDNGIIIRYPKDDMSVYKLLITGKCDDAEEESKKHDAIYSALMDLVSKISKPHKLKLYLSYIPKPICYSDNKKSFVYMFDKTQYNIQCIYGMEYMIPLELKGNYFNNTYIQVHIASYLTDKHDEKIVGFKRGNNNEYKGYMIGTANHMIEILKSIHENDKYVGIEKPETPNEIFGCMGYICAIECFMCKYIPYDLQFMLSYHSHDKSIKVVGFDFGIFQEYIELDDQTMDKITDALLNSPYVDGWEDEYWNATEGYSVSFIKGMEEAVELIGGEVEQRYLKYMRYIANKGVLFFV